MLGTCYHSIEERIDKTLYTRFTLIFPRFISFFIFGTCFEFFLLSKYNYKHSNFYRFDSSIFKMTCPKNIVPDIDFTIEWKSFWWRTFLGFNKYLRYMWIYYLFAIFSRRISSWCHTSSKLGQYLVLWLVSTFCFGSKEFTQCFYTIYEHLNTMRILLNWVKFD